MQQKNGKQEQEVKKAEGEESSRDVLLHLAGKRAMWLSICQIAAEKLNDIDK